MSANTRRERSEDMAKLASLHAQAIGYIEKGKRSRGQIQALLKALQYFKENRLGCAIPVLDQEQLAGSTDLHKLLSLKLEETSLGKGTTLAHLTKHGIEYIGELYTVNWKDARRIGKTVHELLWSLGLPAELDLAEVKWVPPYVTRDFMWKMQQPMEIFIKVSETEHAFRFDDRLKLVAYLQRYFQYTGDVFSATQRGWGRYGWGFQLIHFQRCLIQGSGLRAGMYCPNWQKPPDPPK